MAWYSFLTGNSDAVESAVDGAVGLLDNAFFTDQERSAASTKMMEFRMQFAIKTQSMSISRRVITVAVVAMWLLLVLLLVIFGSIAGGKSDTVLFLFDIMEDIVMPPFIVIVGFYFLSQVVSKAKASP